MLLVTLWRKFTHDLFSTYSSSASPESGLGTSHTSLPGSGGGNDPAAAEEMYYEAEPLQPLGTCKALYTFEGECVAGVEECPSCVCSPPPSVLSATSEGSIPMTENEELQVIELDQGDGWTRVRRVAGQNGWEEGFVPTSYIESTLFA